MFVLCRVGDRRNLQLGSGNRHVNQECMGWRDGSAGKGTCWQALQTAFNAWSTQGRREPILNMLFSDLHAHATAHVCPSGSGPQNNYTKLIKPKRIMIWYAKCSDTVRCKSSCSFAGGSLAVGGDVAEEVGRNKRS